MKKSHVEIAVCAAIIVAVALLGRWAFSVDTYAQDGIQPTPTPTVTPTTLAILAIPEDSPDQGVAYTPTPTATLTHREVIATAVARERQTRVARQNATATAAAAATATAKANPPTATFTATPTDTPTPTGRGPRPIVGPGPMLTPTFTPTPDPRTNQNAPIPFSASLLERSRNLAVDRLYQWDVFGSEEYELWVIPQGGAVIGDYLFRLVFNTDQTGIYEDWRDGKCPAHPSANATTWAPLTNPARVNLIRCEVGLDVNRGIDLEVKRGIRGRVVTIDVTPELRQSIHQPDNYVPYVVLPGFEGTAPSYLQSVGDDDSALDAYRRQGNALVERNTRVSANRWKHASGISRLFAEVSSASAEVEVKHFWHNGTPRDDTCQNIWDAMACALLKLESLQISGRDSNQDHIKSGEVWLRWPPFGINRDGQISLWTTDYGKATHDETRAQYIYLPTTLLHELGHTLGLDHLPNDPKKESIMRERYSFTSDPPKDFTSHDLHGLEEVVGTHAHTR